MTREEAIHEIEKVFEPAFANYIITALTEGATSSDKEPQPCEDCISREQAVYVASGYCAPQNIADELRKLPSVQPHTRWIPVSEGLPKKNEYIGNVCKYYLIQDEYGDMHVAHLSNVGWIPMDSLKAIGNEIIAWRELPQSYKAESEG